MDLIYKYIFLGVLVMFLAIACKQSGNKTKQLISYKQTLVVKTSTGDTSSFKNNDPHQVYDTVFTPFKSDTTYKAHLHIARNFDYLEEHNNGYLIFSHGSQILFKDSLSCPFFISKLADMNNDGVKDLLIINSSSARSNEGFNLYLVKEKGHQLKRVEGFEEILDPQFVAKENTIEGSAVWGNNITYTYHRINRQDKLIKLRPDEDEEVK